MKWYLTDPDLVRYACPTLTAAQNNSEDTQMIEEWVNSRAGSMNTDGKCLFVLKVDPHVEGAYIVRHQWIESTGFWWWKKVTRKTEDYTGKLYFISLLTGLPAMAPLLIFMASAVHRFRRKCLEIDVPEDLIDMDPETFNRSEGTHWTSF